MADLLAPKSQFLGVDMWRPVFRGQGVGDFP